MPDKIYQIQQKPKKNESKINNEQINGVGVDQNSCEKHEFGLHGNCNGFTLLRCQVYKKKSDKVTIRMVITNRFLTQDCAEKTMRYNSEFVLDKYGYVYTFNALFISELVLLQPALVNTP
ncbi:hypothetical protein HUJ05_000882 [Dendroctonus ponderosae]|nr:hypothetical protein HUJ05_000882 [Dendroctonus ponderosae]